VKSFLYAATLLVLCLTAVAQAQTAAEINKRQYIGVVTPDATTTCSYTFSAGTANAFIKFCVTKNGNIVQFASPSGIEYIAHAPAGEGYGFCDFNTQVSYYDYAGYGDSGNWQPPVKVSQTASSVKISRKTSDGRFTLVQTISLVPANILANVQMTITNNSAATAHIGLLRYADADVQNNPNNSFDTTLRTVFGYNNGQYGLTLRHASGSALNGGIVQAIPGGPNPCQPFLHSLSPFSGDGSLEMQYDFQLSKATTKSVIVQYRSF
jgi:hypothetical protein